MAVAATKLQTTDIEQRMQWEEITIQNGDTLSVLAQRYNTDIATLKTANNLAGTSIRAGRPLLIPVNGAPSSTADKAKPGTVAYTIRPGTPYGLLQNNTT